jgi:hypothetical protein
MQYLNSLDIELFVFFALARASLLLDAPSLVSQIGRNGIVWVKDGSKWCCKVGECGKTYVVKWLLTTHLKKVHDLIINKGKLGHLSTCEGGAFNAINVNP